MMTAGNIACSASAVFGLKQLPDMLSSGQMIYSMGLFATPEAGAKNGRDDKTGTRKI